MEQKFNEIWVRRQAWLVSVCLTPVDEYTMEAFMLAEMAPGSRDGGG